MLRRARFAILSVLFTVHAVPAMATTGCPSGMLFEPNPTGATVDAGWTGIAQNLPVVGYTLRMGVSCGPSSPPCGSCTLTGLIPNAGGNNQRCRNDTSIVCTVATEVADCGGAGLCTFWAGPPTPINTGGITTCYTSEITGPVTGTVNVDTGLLAPDVPFQAALYNGITNDQACPKCVGDPVSNDNVRGGTCSGGVRNGLTCDANATAFHPDFGSTSFDCPPTSNIANFVLGTLRYRTGSQNVTLSAASPPCTGFAPGLKCLCDTCNVTTPAMSTCFTNADCPAGGGAPGVCGGRRCLAGADDGLPCRTCAGGTNDGGTCSTGTACPAGICIRPTCAAGGACARHGEPTQPNDCIDTTAMPGDGSLCVDTGTLGDSKGECPEGPIHGKCSASSGHAHRDCLDETDCCDDPFFGCTADPPTPGECLITNRPCFMDNGMIGGSVNVSGAATAPVGNTSSPTNLGALPCIPPVGSASVNTVGGFPGIAITYQPGQAIFAEEILVDVVPPGGTATTAGSGPASVVETSVTTPVGGEVQIIGTFNAGSPPSGYEFLGRLVQITAQPASAASPLRISFDIDAAEIPLGQNESTIDIFRNGVGPIPNCLGATQAIPDDPCVTERTALGGGDVRIAVLTSAASDWTMGVVDAELCPPAVDPLCKQPFVPLKAQVALTDKEDVKDQLQWKWLSGSETTLGQLGDPVGSDEYRLCLYDGNGRIATLVAPAGGICAGKACWSAKPTGFQYKDKDKTPSGIEQIVLKAGIDGKAKIQVKGKGVNLPMPTLSPFVSPLTVQLRNATSNVCWSATYSAPFTKNDATVLKDKAD